MEQRLLIHVHLQKEAGGRHVSAEATKQPRERTERKRKRKRKGKEKEAQLASTIIVFLVLRHFFPLSLYYILVRAFARIQLRNACTGLDGRQPSQKCSRRHAKEKQGRISACFFTFFSRRLLLFLVACLSPRMVTHQKLSRRHAEKD